MRIEELENWAGFFCDFNSRARRHNCTAIFLMMELLDDALKECAFPYSRNLVMVMIMIIKCQVDNNIVLSILNIYIYIYL